MDNFVSYNWMEMQPMKIRRGLMGSVYMKGYVYIAGGVTTRSDDTFGGVIKKWERYNIKDDYWEVIASLNEKRKNTSLWVVENKYIYAFGGWQQELSYVERIERYEHVENLSETTNKLEPDQWESLNVFLPEFMSSIVSYAINDKIILLFGGWFKNKFTNAFSQDDNPSLSQAKSKQVYKFIIEHQQFLPEKKELDEPLISIYPPFVLEDQILLINEDVKQNCPKVLRYDISKAIL